MSCSTLYQIRPDGDVVAFLDFGNAWLGAFSIWSKLAVEYRIVGSGDEAMILARPVVLEKLFALLKRPEVRLCDRIVLGSTSDMACIRREDFGRLADAFREFVSRYQNSDDRHHTLRWADALASIPCGSIGCAFQQTSVSESPWDIRSEDDNEWRSYNVMRDEGHFWLFDEIEGEIQEPQATQPSE